MTDPDREFALQVVRRLQQAGYTALWAGGCVRDFLLGEQPHDFDVATNARPDQVRELFGHRRTLAVGESFGVIIVRGPQEVAPIEVATFRTEGPYLDGRRPEHVRYSTPEEDAQRRDFTINGMFFDPIAGQVLDYVGGQHDLKLRIVRAIGDPHARIQEDKLRMLRAVRMTARFNFTLDSVTAAAVRSHADQILVVSQERIAQELKKMLVHERRALAMHLTHEQFLLTKILPELAPVASPLLQATEPLFTGTETGTLPLITDPALFLTPQVLSHLEQFRDSAPRWHKTLRMLQLLEDPSFELALAVLLHDLRAHVELHEAELFPGASTPVSGHATHAPHSSHAQHSSRESPPSDALCERTGRQVREICKRLRLSNQETEAIVWLVTYQHALRRSPELPIPRLKRLLAHPQASHLLKLHRVAAEAVHGDLTAVEFCEDFLRRTPPEALNPPTLVTGADLISQGLAPGIKFKWVLEKLRDAQLTGDLTDKSTALKLATELHESAPDAIGDE